ncbi:hypothetical protein BDV59DRAFT_195244 [Aspergillus ambiguus]|uniref:uncharacterized protein n=1 Tax=Aspergillus ambiguus TaxID=176160 RepID=UPI003CCCA98B
MSCDYPSQLNQPLPTVIETRASQTPERLWAYFPVTFQADVKNSPYEECNFQRVTYRDFNNAINRTAWLLKEAVGDTPHFETLAYLGPADLRYSIVVVAGIKAGFKTFLPSPRNSKVAFQTMLSKLSCRVLLTTTPEPPSIKRMTDGYAMAKVIIPSLEELLDCSVVKDYPYSKCLNHARSDPIFVLHTSGSTGIPKPLVYTNEFVTRLAQVSSLSEPKSGEAYNLSRLYTTGLFYCMLPPFHAAGLGLTLLIPAYFNCVPVYPPSGSPPSINTLMSTIHKVGMDWALLAPNVVTDMAREQNILHVVARCVKYVIYIGGSIPQAAGDTVSRSVPLYQLLGSSECGLFPLIRLRDEKDREDWNYIQIHPFYGAEFRHQYEDVYELCVVQRAGSFCSPAVFTHFPQDGEYRTKDLFRPHPTKPSMWIHCGRSDDIIVLLNGEKTNPTSFEQHVSQHPDVAAALVAGNHREETLLLLEARHDASSPPENPSNIIERVWPTIEEANRYCPAHAIIAKNRVLITDPAKPMARAGKGTIQRQATWQLYADEIESAFSDSLPHCHQNTHIDLTDKAHVEQTLSHILRDITQWDEIKPDDDFFSRGMDSLQALQLRRQLRVTFNLPSIEISAIYTNPSLSLLSEAIMLNSYQGTGIANEADRLSRMETYIRKYTNKIDQISRNTPEHRKPENPAMGHSVILTGSTGAIGSHILRELVQTSSVNQIYCLNRSAGGQDAQIARDLERGMSPCPEVPRIKFFQADLSQPNLGLRAEEYASIRSTVTMIIHNAWPVNFIQPLPFFESSLDGVLNLIHLASAAPHRPSVIFLSSIAAVLDTHRTKEPLFSIPEAFIPDTLCATSSGYGESKYIGEALLDYAVRCLHVNAASCRIGQVAGTTEAPYSWNRMEWFPSLIISSKHLGVLPSSLGSGKRENSISREIDWIPIDRISEIIVELSLLLAGTQRGGSIRVFHPVHPRPSKWETLLPVIRDTLSAGRGWVNSWFDPSKVVIR